MARGVSHFAQYFAGDEAKYVLIGGVPTVLLLEQGGLAARATKDLDVVLCIEALTLDFGRKLWGYIDQGGYAIREQGPAPHRFYRFIKPTRSEFPQMLEFFAREPGFAPLADGAHLTPVPLGEAVASLSAILLDADYYAFIHAHKRVLDGLSIVSEMCLIPLKARAWLDLSARKAAGEAIDEDDIRKHRKDVIRLSQLLSADEPTQLPGPIAADLDRFLTTLEADLTPQQLKDLSVRVSPIELTARIRTSFGLGGHG
ncbi:MAG: hypothetical protein WC809_02635 [Sinimarinibacterium sp.]|jgi:hypothetical protein